MASRFAHLFLAATLVAASFSSILAGGDDIDGSGEDPLIRQVVDHGNGGEKAPLDADHHFELFKRKFGKTYATQEEHDHRFSVFKANIRRARRHQKLDPSAEHGVTLFSDLTGSEFRRQLLGVNRILRLPADAHKAEILPTNDLPTDFDWRDHGAVTPVKNQAHSNFLLKLMERNVEYLNYLFSRIYISFLAYSTWEYTVWGNDFAVVFTRAHWKILFIFFELNFYSWGAVDYIPF